MPMAPQLREDGNGFNASYATPQDVAAAQSDPLSPTMIAQQFLSRQGIPLTSENMRRAMTMNANQPGYIPGLINNEPPVDPAMAAQQSGQATPQTAASTQPMPTPPIPPQQSGPSMSTVQNSTMPSDGEGISGTNILELLGMAIAAGLPLIFGNRMSGQAGVTPGTALTERQFPTASAERVPNDGPTIVGRAPTQITGPGMNTQLPPGGAPTMIAPPDTPPLLPNGGAQAQLPAPIDSRAHMKVPVPDVTNPSTRTPQSRAQVLDQMRRRVPRIPRP